MTTNKELVKQLAVSEETPPAKEPALSTASVITIVMSIIVAGTQLIFHKQIPDDIQTFIYGALALVLPMITAFLIRRKVWSPASVVKVVDESVKTALETATVLQSNQVKLISTDPPAMSPEDVKKFRRDIGLIE
jgi:hypothetical protein